MLLPDINRKTISTAYLVHNWEGSVVDFIENEDIPFNERLSIVIDYELISPKLLRLFSIWCARQVLKFTHARIISELLDTAEDFAYGRIDRETLVSKYLKTIKELALEDKTRCVQEAEEAAYSSVRKHAKDAARESSLHSQNVLSHYTEETEIQRKHVWKIRDLILDHLTTGDVDFILKNTHPGKEHG